MNIYIYTYIYSEKIDKYLYIARELKSYESNGDINQSSENNLEEVKLIQRELEI